MDSCTGDEKIEVKIIDSLLKRVFRNKEQLDRLYRFLRTRYGSQLHTLSSSTINYLVRERKKNKNDFCKREFSIALIFLFL